MLRSARIVVILGLIAVVVSGCIGGGGTGFVRSEIDSFFSLFAHRIETQDVASLTSMYQIPVTFTAVDTNTEVKINSTKDLYDILAARFYADSDLFEIKDAQIIVVSASGKGNEATASVIVVLKVVGLYTESTYRDSYEIDVSLQKLDGSWRIRAEHIRSASYE